MFLNYNIFASNPGNITIQHSNDDIHISSSASDCNILMMISIYPVLLLTAGMCIYIESELNVACNIFIQFFSQTSLNKER